MAVPPQVTHFQHPNQTRNLNRDQKLVYPGINVPDRDGISGQNAFANKNKWIAEVPIYLVLGVDYQNISLNLTTFTIPSIEMGSDKVQYRSIEIEVPNHTMSPGSKEITFNYLVHSDWTDYRALYNWCMNNAPVNKGANALDTGNVNASGLLNCCDIDVTLKNPYKKPVVGFRFKNCWIKSFSDLQLAYDGADEIQHSFTCAYTHFVLLDKNGLETGKFANDLTERDRQIADKKTQAYNDFVSRYGVNNKFQTYGDSQNLTYGSTH